MLFVQQLLLAQNYWEFQNKLVRLYWKDADIIVVTKNPLNDVVLYRMLYLL
ncbi:MAG: hypothetical protein CM1200mP1_08030 [Candidatus Neomarinimicrobiota bacterium]|nr:MAG: hypothetical protein CM1200mP1_08030 [Candidatus Neomarinimicrobiota bacterium]